MENERSLTNLQNKLMSLNIMVKLDQNIYSDPNTNYEILIAEIVNSL